MNKKINSNKSISLSSTDQSTRCKTKDSAQATFTSTLNSITTITPNTKNKTLFLTPFTSNQIAKCIKRTDIIDKEMNSIIFRAKAFKSQSKATRDFAISSNDIEFSIKKLGKKIDISEKQIEKHHQCHMECESDMNAWAQNHQRTKKLGDHFSTNVSQIQKEMEDMRKKIFDLEKEKGEMKLKTIELKEDLKYLNNNEALFENKVKALQLEKQVLVDSVKEIKEKVMEVTKGSKLSDTFYKKITKLISTTYPKQTNK